MAAQPAGPAEGGVARGHGGRVPERALDVVAREEPGAGRGAEDVAAPGGVEDVDAVSRDESGARRETSRARGVTLSEAKGPCLEVWPLRFAQGDSERPVRAVSGGFTIHP